jgi:TRAP-type C4-dicarboxylate transport system permease small subunit
MEKLDKLNRGLVVLETFVAGSLLLIVFLVVLSQVVMRYLFAQPNPWSEELSRFCFIWLSMLGASLAVERRSHFGFDQAVKRLCASRRRFARRLATIVVMMVSLLLVFPGLALVRLTIHQRSPALDLPMAWVYGAVPISGILMLIHLLCRKETEA